MAFSFFDGSFTVLDPKRGDVAFLGVLIRKKLAFSSTFILA